ncbi:unnamed protein product [Penicillium salamii]|nr:unnamed protein product [Penicillium salamii]
MAAKRAAGQQPPVINFSDRMTPHSEELEWYDAVPSYEPAFFRVPKVELRNTQHVTPTVNLFQRYPSLFVCGVRWRESGKDVSTITKSRKGAIVSLSIGGGTEIPHFSLRLRLKTNDPNYVHHDCIFIWPLWNEKNVRSSRTSTSTPADGSTFTFSASIKDANVRKVSLSEAEADACDGKTGDPGYHVEWISCTPPEAAIGLDLPRPARLRLLSESQISAMETFKGLKKSGILVQVVTRIRAPLFEQLWSSMTAMPTPTLAPYPFYSCAYVKQAGLFQPMLQIPGLKDVTIQHHHWHREYGWQSMEHGGFSPEPKLFHQIPSPFGFFINEREYEAIRMIGILREAEATKDTATREWNGQYTFHLFEAFKVHGAERSDLHGFFYGVIEAKAKLTGRGALQEAHQQQLPLPEPGTAVTVDESAAEEGKGRHLWEGVVVSAGGISSVVGEDKPFNAIFFRIKRPASKDPGANSEKLTGLVSFGRPSSGVSQARQAIRYAMWGKETFGISRDNKTKQLLLAKQNRTLQFHERHDTVDGRTNWFLQTNTTLNRTQALAVRSVFSPSTSWRDFCCFITGPPGTGKTYVSLAIAAHCIERGWPLFIVCASNQGLDVIASRIGQYLQGQNVSKKGIYRLSTQTLESYGMSMPSFTSYEDEEHEEGPERQQRSPLRYLEMKKELRRRKVSSELRHMVLSSLESMVEPEHNLSLVARITEDLKKLMSGYEDSLPLGDVRECLWDFLTCQELLRRHSKNTAEQGQAHQMRRPLQNMTTFGATVQELTVQQKALWLDLQEGYLAKARIVLCTASTAGRKVLRAFQPYYLAIEEASQMVEWQTLNAVIRNINTLRKVVLSGDMAQLPPTVISTGSNECDNFEVVSFFEQQSYDPPFVTHHSCKDREKARMFSDVMVARFDCAAGTSFFLSVTDSSVWRRRGCTSFVNPEYINEICSVLRDMDDAGIAEEDVLVLSFYSEERRALEECIHNGMDLKGIRIKSVDAAHGSESPFVLLSTTRPGHNGLGFLANTNRQCVALSRAQDGLLIIGNDHMGALRQGAGYKSWASLVSAHAVSGRLINRNGAGSWEVLTTIGSTEDAFEQVE